MNATILASFSFVSFAQRLKALVIGFVACCMKSYMNLRSPRYCLLVTQMYIRQLVIK